MSQNALTITGSVTGPKDASEYVTLRYDHEGKPIASFRLSHEVYTGVKGQKKRYIYYTVKCFGSLAENVSASLTYGDSVIVQGHLDDEEYEGKDGKTHHGPVIVADDIAPTLRWGTVIVERNERKT
jgi:single-strand DNA-binding protein